ncbi:MAG: hypothetical protein L0H83_02120 [Salinisphaera sp.]|nr:hypothetical protein [Salinisphaera sp.]
MNAPARQAQLAAIAGPCAGGDGEALRPLVGALQQRFAGNLVALLYYGSCWRSGDPYNGLNDFYVIVDSLGVAHRNPASALGNRLLPPNVYYLECAGEAGTLRAKYAVLSLGQLERGARHWFNPCVWGRFAQPAGIVYARSGELQLRLRADLGQCVVTLLERALPALPADCEAASAFAGALALSYRSELRVESKAQGEKLIAGLEEEYQRRALAAAPLLPLSVRIRGTRLLSHVSLRQRLQARLAWPLRSLQGKLLSILRLAKACFTFAGAIDYAAWKLERHTGVDVERSDRLRRHPLIFAWPLLWRLYRRGLLR